MSKSNDILQKAGRRTGMTVPQGYFDDFAERMIASLPVMEWETEADTAASVIKPKRSLWHMARPYVYMAAMFMGIWCMMKMFDHIKPAYYMDTDNNPVLTAALSNDNFMNEFFIDDMGDAEMFDQLW